MPVTEVETGVGLASQPEKYRPPGKDPVKRTKVKSLDELDARKFAPSVCGVPDVGVSPVL